MADDGRPLSEQLQPAAMLEVDVATAEWAQSLNDGTLDYAIKACEDKVHDLQPILDRTREQLAALRSEWTRRRQ